MEAAETAKPDYDGAALAREGAKWMERILASEKREDRWRKDAFSAEKAYSADSEAKDGKLYDFNILHSNVETIVPAIYNSTPIPDVRRRFIEAVGEPPQPPQQQPGQQPDPRAMQQFQMQAQAYAQKQQADKDAKDLGDMIERAIVVQIDDNRLDKEIEAQAQDAFLAGRGVIRIRFEADDDGELISNESIPTEVVSWRDFRMGPGTRWDNVSWIAFRHELPREELEKHKDADLYSSQGPEPVGNGNEDDTIPFWEVWSRDSRCVYLVREHDGRMLRKADDPLGLKAFFPVPEPVQPITLTAKMTPVCPFVIYKKLADELDLITRRINAIMKGLKVRGLTVGDAADLANLAQAGDNELVTASNLEGLAQTKGLENAILWWPIEQAVNVLKQLYIQRETVKQSIYEITGISDIIRGASNAAETATAQQIKTQWGSLRIQKMQRLIERQVRDVFSMMAELIVSKFSEQTLMAMTGIQITDGMRQMMQNPRLAGYRIDVESDSTVRADLTRQKGDMTEFLNGTAQFFGTVGPLVQQAPQMAEPMAEVYSSFARVFKLGKQAEDALDRMAKMAKSAASNPPPNPEQEKAKAEMEMKKAEFGMKMKAEEAKAQRDTQSDARKSAAEDRKAAIEIDKAKMDLAIKTIELDLKKQEAAITLQTKQAETGLKLQAQAAQNAMKAEQAKNGRADQ